MLTASQYDPLLKPIVDLYDEFQTSVINDIARRLGNLSIDSAAWQMQRLTESGAVYDNILKELSILTGKSEAVLKKTFEKAGVKAIKFDDRIYKAAGLEPVPLNMSPAMADVLAAGLKKTKNVMQNLTLTTALSGQDAYIQAADLAYMQVSTGAMSYDQAIRQAVKSVASDGLKVIQFSGRHDQIDVAIRRSVLTGIAQTTGELQLTRADQMGVDLVQTSAHIGARNTGEGPANHESWQGKIFSRSGTSKRYPDFVQETGYGTGQGLMGYNCRHSFYPFFPGISEEIYTEAQRQDYANAKVKLNGDKVSVYEATQRQREIERKIRYWKRRKQALEATGIDGPETQTAILKSGKKVREWQASMREFIEETGLNRQYPREQI